MMVLPIRRLAVVNERQLTDALRWPKVEEDAAQAEAVLDIKLGLHDHRSALLQPRHTTATLRQRERERERERERPAARTRARRRSHRRQRQELAVRAWPPRQLLRCERAPPSHRTYSSALTLHPHHSRTGQRASKASDCQAVPARGPGLSPGPVSAAPSAGLRGTSTSLSGVRCGPRRWLQLETSFKYGG